jgi:uncharacterized protein
MPSVAGRITLEPSAAVEEFAHHAYLNLETYRQDGQPVRTPMWFVLDGGVLLVRSYGPGKVARVQRQPQVRVVPCSARGRPQGLWLEAEARLAETLEIERAKALFAEKYGMLMRLFELMERRGRRSSTFLAIRVAGESVAPSPAGRRTHRARRLRRLAAIIAGSFAASLAATIAGSVVARRAAGRGMRRRGPVVVVVRPRALLLAPNVRIALPFSAIDPGRISGRRGPRLRRQGVFAARRFKAPARRMAGNLRSALLRARG